MTESSFPVWKNISDDYPTFGSDSSQTITNPPTKSTPFTINTTANATLVVAYVAAPITLKTDCIVHPISSSVKGVCAEYKHLSNRAGPELVRELTTKVREHCQSHGNDRLHTADVITTTAGNLSASYCMHVVAPAYTSNYGTAMTNSLSACYVKSLEAAIEECNAKTLAIGGLADRLIRGGFDQNQAYHIALRTIKQFLIKYPNKLQRVMLLTKSKTDCEHVCASIAPLYFPRTQQEVETSKLEFITRSAGDATGAHRTQARRIRVGGAVLDAGEAASPVPNAQRQQASRLAAAATPPASASKFQLSDFPQLNVWKRGKICVRVRDTATHRDVVSDISTGSQFTIYSIRVAETPSLPGYTIWRRYSEFLTLRDCVVEDATRHRSSELAVLTAVPFPSKVWFGSMDPLVVEERRSMFDSLLRTMSSQCTDRTMAQLRTWLTPNNADVERAKSEEEDEEEEEEEAAEVVSFVQDVQDPMANKGKKKSSTTRTVLSNVANKNNNRNVARPSETLKIRRKIRDSASGEGIFNLFSGDTSASASTVKEELLKNQKKTKEIKKKKGPKMHRADVDNKPTGYIAEGNRFITNDLL